jgi:serine/threonine protein phosphatase PrpC
MRDNKVVVCFKSRIGFRYMGFSKIDISLCAGARVQAEQASYVCFNPFAKEGCALFVGASAERAALGGQVAAKLALQHFVEGFVSSSINNPKGEEHVTLLESAFNKANSGVYELGHKLSAGGRMSTSIVSILLDEGAIYAARVGHGQAYLVRSGKAFPFFANEPAKELQTLGTNSLVSVEIATVDLNAGDTIIIFSDSLKAQDEGELADLATLLLPRFNVLDSEGRSKGENRGFAARLEPASCQRLAEQIFDSSHLGFAAIMGISGNLHFLPKQKMAA